MKMFPAKFKRFDFRAPSPAEFRGSSLLAAGLCPDQLAGFLGVNHNVERQLAWAPPRAALARP